MNTHPHTRSQHGYSLAELLTVVAIIGVLSLITVPNFISLYQSSRVKGVVRNFTSDVRNARQMAIAGNQRTRISFDATGKSYTVFREMRDLSTGTRTWSQVRVGNLGEVVNFNSTSFEDTITGDSRPDIIFLTNGTIDTSGAPWLELKTSQRVAKTTYRLTFTPAGTISVT